MPSALNASDRAALDDYLEVWDGESNDVSTLEAGLRDARYTMASGTSLWLATLGYLVVVEQLGRLVARPGTKYPRAGSEQCFVAGARVRSSPCECPDGIWVVRAPVCACP